MSANIKIGLFGFGCVGQGLYDVLSNTKGLRADIVKICVKHREKKRTLPPHHFTYDKYELLNNPEINVIVELIDDVEEAYHIVKTALSSGKHVVSANKRMLAYHIDELIELQRQNNVSLLYEAAACGSIPIIRTLDGYYDNELLNSVTGIFNGSSNYILSKVFNNQTSYDVALKEAQDLGFAETDPTLDVAGFDALHKAVLLALHSYGVFVHPKEVLNLGIQNVSYEDIRYAREKELKIKLVANIKKTSENKFAIYVLPQFVNQHHPLYEVENEFNGVIVEAAFSDKQFFSGKGAGGHPTGSAVLSDISALVYNYKYLYKKRTSENQLQFSKNVPIEIYMRYEEESDLAIFKFKEIIEKYSSGDYNYIIGETTIEQLFKVKEQLAKSNLFVVVKERKVPSISHSLLREKDELITSISIKN